MRFRRHMVRRDGLGPPRPDRRTGAGATLGGSEACRASQTAFQTTFPSQCYSRAVLSHVFYHT